MTMALLKVAGIILTTVTITSFTAPIPTLSPSESLTKRGYSVDPRPADRFSGDGMYAWPGQGKDQDGKNKNPIYYCWWTAEAADKYFGTVDAAIKKWEAALYPNSALRIELFPDTHENPHVLCRDLPQPVDALCLIDGGDTDSKSSLGYDWIQQGKSYRHYFYMGRYDAISRLEAVLDCAHELGHVMGLGHEHQRSDRDQHVRFSCRDLAGEFEARQEIRKNPNDPALGGGTEDEKLERVCQNGDLAEHYFPNALDFMKGQDVNGSPFGQFKDVGDFDDQSIMIYSTWDNTDEGPEDPDNLEEAELAGYDPNTNELWRLSQGGNEDPALAGPSSGDIAAVVGLYPK